MRRPRRTTRLSLSGSPARSVLATALAAAALTILAAGALLAVGVPAARAAGAAPDHAASAPGPAPAAANGADPLFGPGYVLAAADGGVFTFGNSRYFGGMAGHSLAAPVVGVAEAPDGRGYWEASADGGVFAFGSARYYGGMAGQGLEQPIVGMAAVPDGTGYWLVAADGGVFTYGTARYLGAMGGHRLSAPIVGVASTPDGGGYWLVAADGGVFAFGDASYLGGMGGDRLSAPVVGMAATPDGTGYWLASADGGVFTYGTARYYGGMGGLALAAPMVGVAASPTGHGYWLASADGGVFTYGDSGYWGAPGGFGLTRPLTAVAAGLSPAFHAAEAQVGGRYGFDVSWPQCGSSALPSAHAFAVLGVTGGKAFTTNPCLRAQWAWASGASGAAGLYVNLNGADPPSSPTAVDGPAGHCRAGAFPCAAYNYGANAVDFALSYARRAGASSPMWWLDIETGNSWSAQTDLNAEVIRGAVDELHHRHLSAGIYSTGLQWSEITGSARFGVPVWVAGSPDLTSAASYCSRGFNDGPVWMVQTMLAYDVNYLCRPAEAARAFGVHPLPAAPAWPLDRLPVPVHPGLPLPVARGGARPRAGAPGGSSCAAGGGPLGDAGRMTIPLRSFRNPGRSC